MSQLSLLAEKELARLGLRTTCLKARRPGSRFASKINL